MRHKVQALYHDPASLYGFRLEPDAFETLFEAEGTTAPHAPRPVGDTDAGRFGRMIRRNRDALG